jgi:hypothetical protein
MFNSGTKHVSGAQIKLKYDPAKLEVDNAYQESASCNQLNIPLIQSVDSEAGTVTIAKVNKGFTNVLPTGSFCFASIKFKIVGGGATRIEFANTRAEAQIVGPDIDNNSFDSTGNTIAITGVQRYDAKLPEGKASLSVSSPAPEGKVSLRDKAFNIAWNFQFQRRTTDGAYEDLDAETQGWLRFKTEIYLYKVEDTESATPTFAPSGRALPTPTPLGPVPEPGLNLVAIITTMKRTRVGENSRVWNVRKIAAIGTGNYEMLIRILNPNNLSDVLVTKKIPITLTSRSLE